MSMNQANRRAAAALELEALHRRDMLRLGAAAMLASMGGIRVARAQSAAHASAGSQPRLVVVLLRGAMDGLSLVVPYADNAYYQARPNIAIARPGEAGGCVKLDATFGLHPAAAAVRPYWER